ncbi:MAG: replication-associated recombination protein A [Firmicutes bacterium]|nr:replication-associated recombination protein A [Bacillota bacterium]
MRPQSLSEFVGQSHLVGPGKMLRRMIEADQLASIILYGPPGTGKTTLAEIIAKSTNSRFLRLNAVTSGVKEVREVIAEAEEALSLYGQRTVLFIDEIHRFNKAQQDVLLGAVEDGVIILIGATTENPYFEVNSALLSRSRIFQLQPLSREELKEIAKRALESEKGLAQYRPKVTEEALDFLLQASGSDARVLLNALELAVLTTPPGQDGQRLVDLEVAQESIQKSALKYDKAGDNHYDVASAFIKSIRGSDPDAALYWLARMLVAGEDPKFIARRIIISASEDIGNANPQALPLAVAAFDAVDKVGMPEARIILGQVVAYLAASPKSNRAYLAINEAIADVKKDPSPQVPLHLRDASYRGAKEFGHGLGYKYPHDYPGAWVEQQYLPAELAGKTYYHPSENGSELKIKERLERLRQSSGKPT